MKTSKKNGSFGPPSSTGTKKPPDGISARTRSTDGVTAATRILGRCSGWTESAFGGEMTQLSATAAQGEARAMANAARRRARLAGRRKRASAGLVIAVDSE